MIRILLSTLGNQEVIDRGGHLADRSLLSVVSYLSVVSACAGSVCVFGCTAGKLASKYPEIKKGMQVVSVNSIDVGHLDLEVQNGRGERVRG